MIGLLLLADLEVMIFVRNGEAEWLKWTPATDGQISKLGLGKSLKRLDLDMV